MPPFPTDTQPGEDPIGSPDGFALGDTTHAMSAAISASQKASAAPIAAPPRHARFSVPVSAVRVGAMREA